MKTQLLFSLLSFSIFFYTNFNEFEDGTLNNWTNSDGTIINLTNEIHEDPDPMYIGGINYLRKTCDDTNTASGMMSIKSLNFFSGDFIIIDPDGSPAIDGCNFIVRNTNNFDLHLRIVLTGTNNVKIVSTNPFIVPANSGWIQGGFYMNDINSVFTLIPGGATYLDIYSVLASVASTEIIHSTTISTEGENVAGLLEIDAIRYYSLLSVEENNLNNIQVFPNPIKDHLFINFPHKTKGKLTLMSIDGRKLLTQDINTEQMQLDVSTIKSKGIYFLKIETPQGTLTKKVVKA